MSKYISVFLLVLLSGTISAQHKSKHFNVLAIAEPHGIHRPFVDSAQVWLNKLAKESNFTIDYVESPADVNQQYLSKYQLVIQLDYPPYAWSDVAKAAFEKYIEEGKGGWIGFHHATLLGEFDGYTMWSWFSDFMGGIQWKDYIAKFASAQVSVEDTKHPCMKGVPKSFLVTKDEWYTYDKSPRPNVHVLASVNESTYQPSSAIKMGDHPVVWTNDKMKARNIYIFMGHDPSLLQNAAYKRLFRNSVFWAAGK